MRGVGFITAVAMTLVWPGMSTAADRTLMPNVALGTVPDRLVAESDAGKFVAELASRAIAELTTDDLPLPERMRGFAAC